MWIKVAIAASLAATLILQNPYTEKRHSLGPLYLAVAFIVCRPWLESKIRQFLVISAAIVLFLPLAALLTHGRPGNVSIDDLRLSIVTSHFVELHYDAWANIYSTTELVEKNGLFLGRQLLGSMLFFVPSSWWEAKPAATGIEIGRFLIDYYAMWFENLSAPLVAEGYIDFGLFGVLAYSLILGFFASRLDRGALKGRSFVTQAACVYFGFFLVFALRGALMVAVAYGFASAVAFGVVGLVVRLVTARMAPVSAPGSARTSSGA